MTRDFFLMPGVPVFIISFMGLLLYRKTVLNSFPSLIKERRGRLIANGSASVLCDVGIIFSLYLYWYKDISPAILIPYILSALIFSLVGWFDDLVEFRVRKKLVIQLLASAFSVLIFSYYQQISFLEKSALFFLIMWMVNAFNLIDIIDGLFPAIALLLLSGLCLLFPETGQINLVICWIIALAALLCINVAGPYVFSGDAGAHMFGVITSLFVFDGYLLHKEDLKSFIANVLILFALLIFDFCFVVILRLIRKRSPLKKSEDHLALVLGKGIKNRNVILVIFILIQLSLISLINK